jgi:hypothetical protein
MPPVTYESIATQTLGSAAASVTFSSIPATYTDLYFICSLTALNTNSAIGLRFNSDTGTNYSTTRVYGNGTSAVSDRTSNNSYAQLGFAGAELTNQVFQIMNYANTTTNKTAIGRANGAGILAMATVSLWRSTAAIDNIVIRRVDGGNLASGSTFTLYGIRSFA